MLVLWPVHEWFYCLLVLSGTLRSSLTWPRRPSCPCSSTAGTPIKSSLVGLCISWCGWRGMTPLTFCVSVVADIMRRNRERCSGGVVGAHLCCSSHSNYELCSYSNGSHLLEIRLFSFQVHSFDGTADDAAAITDLDLYIGINGWWEHWPHHTCYSNWTWWVQQYWHSLTQVTGGLIPKWHTMKNFRSFFSHYSFTLCS